MSDEQEKTRIEILREQFGDDIYTKAKWEGRQTDWLIQWFARFMNTGPSGATLPVTFTIGGNLVSGYLISEDEYFDLLASDFSSALPESVRDTGKELIMTLKPVPAVNGEEQPPCQFVHLKLAKVFNGLSSPIPATGTLWRGKISSVEGFSLGTLTVS